jgi:hypothetical protein
MKKTVLISLLPKIEKNKQKKYTSKHGTTTLYYKNIPSQKMPKQRIKDSIKQELVSLEETYSSS